MSYDFPRGSEEIEKSAESRGSGGGNFRPFIQTFFWKDGDERLLLFLNPVEELPKVLMSEPWTENGRKMPVIARTDPAIGEKKDPIQETWQYRPIERFVAIAVELEAESKEVRGRPRLENFTVATREYARRIYDEKGEATDESEDVTTPVVGVVIQSAGNFFRHVSHKDSKRGPITENAVEITRLGGGSDTDYSVEMYDDPVDLTNLVEYFDGISFLDDKEVEKLDKIEDPQELALELGSILLDKWLAEKADIDYYNEVLEQINEPARFAGDKKTSKSSRKASQGRERRPSQRRSAVETQVDKAEAEAQQEPEAEPPKRRRTTRSSPVADRLKELRDEAEAA